MKPGLPDRLANDDPVAGTVRCRPVHRLERDLGTVQPPELAVSLPGQDVQLAALVVGHLLDSALDAIAIDTAALD
jgi:hypothetical protein